MPNLAQIAKHLEGGDSMTKEELKKYLWLRRVIKQLEDRREELETEATRMTVRYSDQPKGAPYDKDRMAELVVEMVELDEKIQAKLAESYELARKIEEAIGSLPEREQYLMRARYIEGKSWEQIAVDMHYSWRQVHNIHSMALRAVMEIG